MIRLCVTFVEGGRAIVGGGGGLVEGVGNRFVLTPSAASALYVISVVIFSCSDFFFSNFMF